MFKGLYKEICSLSNLLFGILVISIEVAICGFIVTVVYVIMANDLVKKNSLIEQENIELKWELEQVDQMICNYEER